MKLATGGPRARIAVALFPLLLLFGGTSTAASARAPHRPSPPGTRPPPSCKLGALQSAGASAAFAARVGAWRREYGDAAAWYALNPSSQTLTDPRP